MNIPKPPRFLILTTLAIFLFVSAGAILFLRPLKMPSIQAPVSKSP